MSDSQKKDTYHKDEENKKVILLDLSRTERAFEEEESLWDIEIKKIKVRLEDHIESLESYKDERDVRKKPLLSIAILGYPGSGKTSMLHTLVERVNREKTGRNFLDNVYSLPMIKPNLVEKDDHFLYAFLAEALRADRKQHQSEEDQDNERQFISRVQHRFQEVSEYLQVLNEAGQKHEGDPLGVSLERLERHESGLMLIEKMAGFIDELAMSLGGSNKSSVVLLPVDDADMSKEVLVSALDTCWRFIKHPRLVPIFTFTGRLAEELLRVNYDKKLDSGSSSEKLKEASTSMLVTDNMAIQHLGKLFPVRNRIKMGQASARVQAAEYQPLKKGDEKKKVSELLQTASKLLFGHAPLFAGNHIRPPLRMVTLRRQIQIIDAIQGTGIERFMENYNTGNKEETPKAWSEIFDMAAWSLLNAHRDVLKEIHLNLDDLYSWTPKGLRQVILDSILMQNKEDLGKLHKHWRYRTDDRRSQIISLLAVNTFRPRMDEEPTGDDAPSIIDEWWDNYKEKDKKDDKYKKELEEASKFFPAIKGALWFLNLCIGFYLPQLFSWRGLPGIEDKNIETSRVTGIGWELLSGPLHAVQEALKKKKVFSSGMLFLEPGDFNEALDDKNKYYRFFVHTWCYYGFYDEWPWAAISLWRGLGLMGKIIAVFGNYQKCSDDHNNCIFAQDDNDSHNDKGELKTKIEKVIKRHFESARVFSNLPKGKDIPSKFQDLNTKDWEYKDDAAIDREEEDRVEKLIPEFADAMISWLKANCSFFYYEDDNKKSEKKPKEKENRLKPMANDGNWESCFIRRLHGDSLMGTFLQKLENVYFKKNLKEWNAGLILYQWKKLLSQYWEGCAEIKNLLESCPIWPDFRSHDRYKQLAQAPPKFNWRTVKVLPVEESVDELEKKIVELDKALKKMDNEKKKRLEIKKLKKIENFVKEIKEIVKKKKEFDDGTVKKDVEGKIKELEEVIKKREADIKKMGLDFIESVYSEKIGIKRAFLENYELFSGHKKPSKHKLEGELNILQETKNDPGGVEEKNNQKVEEKKEG